ncbi:MAG: hypothetical protein RMJ07_00640 [Nitrososphaerota archaeon]|nr:hypothetical protein [Candidatus Bathyarchaeota archaeon]MDW8048180.1 hypothetical protein [Nitrososphaerota archaeon]
MESHRITRFSILSYYYLFSGFILLIASVWSNPLLPHVFALGVLSLILCYGLRKRGRWVLYLSPLVMLPSIVFASASSFAIFSAFQLSVFEGLLISALTIHALLSFASLLFLVASAKDLK